MYRWTVLLQTWMPSLSSSPRRRLAPQRGLRVAISRISAAHAVGGRPDGRERRRQNTRKPARCQRRMVAGWTSNVASRRRQACGDPHREALPRCPADPPRDLALRHDELLPEQRVFGDETGAAAQDVGGQPHHEPKDVDHAARRTAASARMTFVARTSLAPGQPTACYPALL